MFREQGGGGRHVEDKLWFGEALNDFDHWVYMSQLFDPLSLSDISLRFWWAGYYFSIGQTHYVLGRFRGSNCFFYIRHGKAEVFHSNPKHPLYRIIRQPVVQFFRISSLVHWRWCSKVATICPKLWNQTEESPNLYARSCCKKHLETNHLFCGIRPTPSPTFNSGGKSRVKAMKSVSVSPKLIWQQVTGQWKGREPRIVAGKYKTERALACLTMFVTGIWWQQRRTWEVRRHMPAYSDRSVDGGNVSPTLFSQLRRTLSIAWVAHAFGMTCQNNGQ